ncbi:hypothetical protein WN51_10463 [Melipona quadrifasciata]|uniref:Uncharacterized protein n=1 Tax=Melipona quadrifasciata TaxID=166423 RepID=A0A0M9A6V4_9HYME|nr:hypothetical protein WN51_10463 [Melipona quadrifasciata]
MELLIWVINSSVKMPRCIYPVYINLTGTALDSMNERKVTRKDIITESDFSGGNSEKIGPL